MITQLPLKVKHNTFPASGFSVFPAVRMPYKYEGTLADDAEIILPTLRKPGWGSLTLGDDLARSLFTFKVDGTVHFVQNDPDQVVANADTDGLFCIGTSVANPLTLKNRKGSSQDVVLTLW